MTQLGVHVKYCWKMGSIAVVHVSQNKMSYASVKTPNGQILFLKKRERVSLIAVWLGRRASILVTSCICSDTANQIISDLQVQMACHKIPFCPPFGAK